MSYNFTNDGLRNRWFPGSDTASKLSRAASSLGSAASRGWSTAQIVLAVTVGLVAVTAGLSGYAGLILSSITTFNLNNYYYGRIGELGYAVLNPDAPLFVDTDVQPPVAYLTCSGADSNLCSYVSYLNSSIDTFNIFMINGTNITLSSLSYSNGASFMYNVTNGKTALDNLVDNTIYLQNQINDFVTSNGTVTLSLLPYTNAASFMANVTNGKDALDNLVGEAVVLQNQINGITLSTLSYTNGASFMYNVTNGKTALDNLVGEAVMLQNQVDAITLSTLSYTNPAFFTTNVTSGKGALDNLIGEVVIQSEQISALNAVTSRTFYVSATYGNDGTCDATKLKPCATLYKTLQFYPNVTSEFAQNTILFDNGLYSESNYIEIPPNAIFAGNEIGTLLIFAAGAGYRPAAWAYTGTGYVSWLRWGLIRCTGAPCHFNEADVAPATPIFAVHRFYNSTLEAVTPFAFTRAANTSSYLRLMMESTVLTTGSLTVQDPTQLDWSLSGDNYATVSINYNTSLTYFPGVAVINMAGLIPHAAVAVNNYVPSLSIDWSVTNVVLRGSATMTRTYVSGAVIDVHGDVLSLGSINGGLLSSGAGSGSTEYLTNAPGLGYTPVNSSFWTTGVPVQAGDALDKLAARTYNLEILLAPSSYYSLAPAALPGGVSVYPFNYDLTTGTELIVGTNFFSRPGAFSLTYNGSVSHTFKFSCLLRFVVGFTANAYMDITFHGNGGTYCTWQKDISYNTVAAGSQFWSVEIGCVVTFAPGNDMFLTFNNLGGAELVNGFISGGIAGTYFAFNQIS